MTLHHDLVQARLEELALVVAELAKYRGIAPDALGRDLALRWIVERGILAAAGLVFDVADHILAATFSEYPASYEASLLALRDRGVISGDLHASMRGLGHVRNLLAHDYVKVDLTLLARHLEEALAFLPAFSQEIAGWIDERRS
jgi:uncharacterized protein YutE (UPF0331/DUF86 family)